MTENGAAPQQPGFNLQGRFYPTPTRFLLGDPILVSEVTGISWAEFLERLDDEEQQNDPALMLGILAVAVWHEHPKWRRDRVCAYIQQVGFEEIEAVQPETEDEEADADPPPDGGDGGSSERPPESNGTQGSTSTPSSPPTSGQAASTTGSPG